jgi:hypothetical protein
VITGVTTFLAVAGVTVVAIGVGFAGEGAIELTAVIGIGVPVVTFLVEGVVHVPVAAAALAAALVDADETTHRAAARTVAQPHTLVAHEVARITTRVSGRIAARVAIVVAAVPRSVEISLFRGAAGE